MRPKEALIVMGPKKVEMAARTRETHEWMLAPDHVIGVGQVRVLLPLRRQAARPGTSVRKTSYIRHATRHTVGTYYSHVAYTAGTHYLSEEKSFIRG